MASETERDEVTGRETTGHEWDGIRELNTPLPQWWLYTFYATIIWAVGYWIMMPAIPLMTTYTKGVLGLSDRVEVTQELAAVAKARAAQGEALKAAGLKEILGNPDLREFAMAGGRSAFGVNCAPCHGRGAAGAKGFPNLNDDDWLWGGKLDQIYRTIRFGIRADNDNTRDSEMPAFGRDELLTAAQIGDVAVYVRSLSGHKGDAAAVDRGRKVFEVNCLGCHGKGGIGNRALGAPRLSDAIWLYGGSLKDIVATVTNSRHGVMPAWEGKLDSVTLKQLAVYVHSLGGGE